jgi:membrane-bound ClpP family serine protease
LEVTAVSISTLAAAAGAEIVYTLLAAALLILAVRLARPAPGWTLIVGIVSLVSGAVGLAMLPLHAAGILMLVFAAASLAMEVLMFPGVGIHAAGAGVALLFAGLFLTGEPPSAHPGLVTPVALTVAVVAFHAGRRSWRRVRDQPFDATDGLVGRGTVVLAVDGAGEYGVVGGELWPLQAARGRLSDGQRVRVTETAGDCLVVEPTSRRSYDR